MHVADLAGVVTALVTPFRDGRLDEPAVLRLVARQVAAGIQGVIVGAQAAGEGATLRPDERRRLIAPCVSAVAGRAIVIADGSSNATSTAIGLVGEARDAGADAALVSAPWYNRPSQEGVFRHYEAISQAIDLPLLIENSPQRAAIDIQDTTLLRLAALPNVIGLEEAGVDVARVSAIRNRCGAHFRLLAGRDASALGALSQGACGVISLTANVEPRAMVTMYRHWAAGDLNGALATHDSLFGLHQVLSGDATPSAVKLALSALRLCEPDVRSPIIPVSEDVGRQILAAIKGVDVGRLGALDSIRGGDTGPTPRV